VAVIEDNSPNSERVISALKKELGAVPLCTDDPKFQELLEKERKGTLSMEERDLLNNLYRGATIES